MLYIDVTKTIKTQMRDKSSGNIAESAEERKKFPAIHSCENHCSVQSASVAGIGQSVHEPERTRRIARRHSLEQTCGLQHLAGAGSCICKIIYRRNRK